MKPYFVILSILLLTGCFKNKNIEFEGKTPGVKNGVFIIKTTGDSTVYGENIKDGVFAVRKQALKYPGYYTMNITDNDNNDKHEPFEVYLEGGKYIIETAPQQLFRYPKITSPSKIQEQLSAFYTLSDKLGTNTSLEVNQLNNEIKDKGNSLSQLAYTQLLNKLSAAETSMATNSVTAFKEFVKQYPNSEVSAHLMSKLSYEDDPASYYAIFKTLTPAAQNSDEGKEIGEKLSHLVKLIAGSKAPAIAGNTPDGKPFDPKIINAKVILIDFWRASDEISRKNHELLAQELGSFKDSKTLAIIGVSMDTKPTWWTTAIKDDHLTWTQVSDLKGDDSPNAANWSITKIPTYYLLDGNWNIIERDVNIDGINLAVNDYLKKH
jgi:hypothetical protein